MTADHASGAAGIESRVLDIVSGLVAEVRADGQRITVAPGDLLERDLGISSLERIELWLRLEQAFGVRLPESLMAEAERPADLIAALAAAGPALEEPPPVPWLGSGAPAPAPSSARTLVDVFRWHAQATPDRVQVVLREGDGQERRITYGALWERATAIAAGLRARGVTDGESVALMLRTEEAFFPGFLGTLLAGGVPVPIYPPYRADRIEEYAHRQSGILRNAGARVLVTFAEAEHVAGLLRGRAPALAAVVAVDRLGLPGTPVPPPRLRPEDPALIQYHVGQHGRPEGRAALAREHPRQHPRHRSVARDWAGRRGRELAALVPRHGADRVVAGDLLSWAAGRRHVAARLPVAALAVAPGD